MSEVLEAVWTLIAMMYILTGIVLVNLGISWELGAGGAISGLICIFGGFAVGLINATASWGDNT